MVYGMTSLTRQPQASVLWVEGALRGTVNHHHWLFLADHNYIPLWIITASRLKLHERALERASH